jgi:hypothetical protein
MQDGESSRIRFWMKQKSRAMALWRFVLFCNNSVVFREVMVALSAVRRWCRNVALDLVVAWSCIVMCSNGGVERGCVEYGDSIVRSSVVVFCSGRV